MLPDIHLDQTTFEEMIEQARNRISSYYPQWTDFNYHDPGMTLVELFAWMKEIQQYELDHIGDMHRRKYLNLLGTAPLHRKGALAIACVRADAPMRVPKGTRLVAQDISFETEEECLLPGAGIARCFGFLEKKISYLDGEQLSLGQSLDFYPFGRSALPGTCLFLGFLTPLPKGELLTLTVRVGERDGIARNPAAKDTIPLARLSWSFWNGTEYQAVDVIRDETFGFLFDGRIVFCLPEEMKPVSADGEEGWFLRVCLEDSQYDTPPVLSFLDLNALKLRQKETVAAFLPAKRSAEEEGVLYVRHGLAAMGRIALFSRENDRYCRVEAASWTWEADQGRARVCLPASERHKDNTYWALVSAEDDWYQRHFVVGTGLGFPGHRFMLDEAFADWEDLEILVEEPEEPGVYVRWEKQESFSRSGPEDRHYCLDASVGQICFGDGYHGMAPEGQILLVSYSRVMEERGSIRARNTLQFAWQGWSEIPVFSPWDAFGGRREESTLDAFARVREELKKARNMVSAEDYEQTVLQTPGLRVESCRAIVGTADPGDGAGNEGTIQIVVRPCSLEACPKPGPAFVQNIYRHLEKKRLIGVRLKVVSPIYLRISVFLEVAVWPQYQGAEDLVRQAAEEYLRPRMKQFGGTVSYSGLYGYLDRLECVAEIRSLVLDAKGNGVRRNPYGDLVFPGRGIADRLDIQCSCLMEG